MPTYEYACDDCGKITEAYQSFTDDPLVECPHCGGGLKRVFHSVGIMFKGSGFYSTDAKRAKSSGNGQKKTAKKEKTESKPATSDSSPTKSSDPKP